MYNTHVNKKAPPQSYQDQRERTTQGGATIIARPPQNYKEEIKMAIYDQITAELETRKDRSAWGKGVNAYALELVEELKERAIRTCKALAAGVSLP